MWVHPPAFCASPLAADTHGFCQSILRSHREFTGFSKNGLDRRAALCYNIQAFKKCAIYRGVEQLEARRAHNPEVVGSSPASATKVIPDFGKKSGIFLTSGCKTKLPISRFWGKRSRATPCNSARRLGRLFPQQNPGGTDFHNAVREPLNQSSAAGQRIFCCQLLPISSELP